LVVTAPERAVVLCVDEKSQIQALDRSQPVLPMMPGLPERRTHDYARNGITSLFAAFNVADGIMIGQLHRQHRATEFKKFLVTIDKTVPAELDVHLICDNYGTHKTPDIRAWLARHPRFHMHFTPTGSSWINQVERWFGYLSEQKIRRGVHKSVQALDADIRAWITDWNSNPRPFIDPAGFLVFGWLGGGHEVESGEVAGSAAVEGFAGEVGVEPDKVDGCGGDGVFEAGFVDASVAGLSGAGDRDGLVDGCFDAGAGRVLGLERLAVVVGARSGLCIVDVAGRDR
jgi:transposase